MTQNSPRVDLIVSVDACFTHKRRKGRGADMDYAAHQHPETVFISPADVDAMRELVETLRPEKREKGQITEAAAQPDGFDTGMKVPRSVLQGCGESFGAADEKRQKASTQFFADTGLMAMLCRHDCVLWLVNLTSAGEKQYYVLALIECLFKHIPANLRVGVLYDIGCQLHQSCVNWGFLEEQLPQLHFAISVFHAYGHQWPCQLIYHPRKCVGFGLSDGEGCERFWSSIKLLIAPLRVASVSSYFNYT